ncbi:DUF6986 family protein [Euzebya rosea]|uniref:DUF6986 family protein n=1 Tax=Euzebya rosea TaxID=2052804 RepID=UPI000D3E477A|nr:aldolase [Euzebya rosea]
MGRLTPAATRSLLDGVAEADAAYRRDWPGRPTSRQPAQVLYVPAHRLPKDPVAALGGEARRLLASHAPDGVALASAVDLRPSLADRVHERVRHKLDREPIEDLRVDFEDGYVGHDEGEEGADAVRTGRLVGRMVAEDRCTPFVGLRVKSFTDGLAARSVATLDAFLEAMLDEAGRLPDGFVVTFPKIVAVPHVAAFVDVLAALERAHGLADGTLRFEAQVETTASVLGPDGRVALRDIRDAGAGRLRAVHFGVFDYTAALGVPAEQQRLDHPGCDFARHLMQVTFARTEVRLSDGTTNVAPADDSTPAVHATWRTHAAHVRHSLLHGFEQGWDLHPSHLVSRWATVFGHLLDGIDDVLARLDAWEAGRSGGAVMDEPATVAVLRRRVDRAVECGALDPA